MTFWTNNTKLSNILFDVTHKSTNVTRSSDRVVVSLCSIPLVKHHVLTLPQFSISDSFCLHFVCSQWGALLNSDRRTCQRGHQPDLNWVNLICWARRSHTRSAFLARLDGSVAVFTSYQQLASDSAWPELCMHVLFEGGVMYGNDQSWQLLLPGDVMQRCRGHGGRLSVGGWDLICLFNG